jgi:MFS family permease
MGYASMPLLPLYLAFLGADRTQIGTVMAIAALGGLAVRPVVGWALDALGRRTTVVAGTLFMVASLGMLGVVTQMGPLLYGVRILFGIGAGALFTGYFTFVSDVIPEGRRTEGIALFGIFGILPLLLNPFVGELELAPQQLRWFFPLVGCGVLLSLLPVATLEETTARGKASGVWRVGRVVRALGHGSLWAPWLAMVLLAGPVAVYLTFATVTAEARGLSNPGLMYVTYSLGAIVVRVLGARVPDRVGPANLITPALASFAGGLLVLAQADSPFAFLLAGLLAGLGHGYCFPVVMSQVVTRAPVRLRGSSVAVVTGLFDLTALVATPLYGWLADGFGDEAMYLICAAVTVVGLVIWAVVEQLTGIFAPALRRESKDEEDKEVGQR